LHKALHRQRINRVSLRKEFFKTDVETIRQCVEENHGEVSYVADAEALEYHQSIQMSEEDYEFIEQAFDALEDEEAQDVIDDI